MSPDPARLPDSMRAPRLRHPDTPAEALARGAPLPAVALPGPRHAHVTWPRSEVHSYQTAPMSPTGLRRLDCCSGSSQTWTSSHDVVSCSR
jgi:hypothetical protein